MSVNMNGVMETYSAYSKGAGKAGQSKEYGKTVGKPELSEEGKKYYEELKKKFSNMDFILVSDDMIDQAKANSARFANPHKTVVLISEEKVERKQLWPDPALLEIRPSGRRPQRSRVS